MVHRFAWDCGLILRDNTPLFLSQKKVLIFMQAIEALLRRYSPRALKEPAPDDAALALIFQSATRAPDHGRLRPWRFIVIKSEARAQFGELLADHLRSTITKRLDQVPSTRAGGSVLLDPLN